MRTLTITAALAIAASLGGYAVVAATSTPASASTTAGAHTLCGAHADVTSLTVHRIDVINKETFGFPGTVTVVASGAATVASEVCSLPAIPKGVYFCPDAYGPNYKLVFTVDGRHVVVDASPTGCPSVWFAHPMPRTAERQATEGFWTALGTAMGIASPSEATFAGTLS